MDFIFSETHTHKHTHTHQVQQMPCKLYNTLNPFLYFLPFGSMLLHVAKVRPSK